MVCCRPKCHYAVDDCMVRRNHLTWGENSLDRGNSLCTSPGGVSVFGVFDETPGWLKLKEGEGKRRGDEVQEGAWFQAPGSPEEPSKTPRWEGLGDWEHRRARLCVMLWKAPSVWGPILNSAFLLALFLSSGDFILVFKGLREMEVLSCVNYVNWTQVQDHKYEIVFKDKMVPSSEDIKKRLSPRTSVFQVSLIVCTHTCYCINIVDCY